MGFNEESASQRKLGFIFKSLYRQSEIMQMQNCQLRRLNIYRFSWVNRGGLYYELWSHLQWYIYRHSQDRQTQCSDKFVGFLKALRTSCNFLLPLISPIALGETKFTLMLSVFCCCFSVLCVFVVVVLLVGPKNEELLLIYYWKTT